MKTLHLSIIITVLIFAMLSLNSAFAQIQFQDPHDQLYSIFEGTYQGFGGIFLDASGKLNVYVADPVQAKSIGTKVIEKYIEPSEYPNGIIFLKGKVPWHVWAQWRDIVGTLANNRTLGIIEYGVDDKNQVLLIGFESLDTVKANEVETFLKSHQIPLDMVKLFMAKIQPLGEFPLAIPILLISILSVIIFYRIRSSFRI